MEKNIKDSQRRAVQYWFADGLTELGGGILCLLIAIYFAIQPLLESSPGAFALVFVAVFAGAYGLRKLMSWMRTRSTYQQTGYVELKRGWENRGLLLISIIFTVILLMVMAYLVTRGSRGIESIAIIGGVIFAFIFGMAGYEARLVRFIYLAVFSLTLGGVLALSGLGDFWGAALLSMIIGLVLLTFGTITRRVYLRQSTLAREEPGGKS